MAKMDSILNSIKKSLGIPSDYSEFDEDVMMHINTSFLTLNQIGAGPKDPFSISDEKATWEDFYEGAIDLEAVKTFIYLNVRLIFDPPANSFVVDSMRKTMDELQWRICSQTDTARNLDPENPDVPSGDTIDYNSLKNLPTFNGKTLKGNVTEEDPLSPKKELSPSKLQELWNETVGGSNG